MRILIDTCVFVSILEDKISKEANDILHDYSNQFYLCSESVKEIIHLAKNGKIQFRKEYNVKKLDLFKLIEEDLGIEIKYVNKEHFKRFLTLRLVEGHNDPSDQVIISLALTEKLTVISSDNAFPKYEPQGLDVIKVSIGK